jgi:hypothetical protein
MFRRSLPNGAPKHRLDHLANRLTEILTETRKLNPVGQQAEIGRKSRLPVKVDEAVYRYLSTTQARRPN